MATAAPAHAAVSSAPQATTPMFNGTIWAVAYAAETVYVGGDFTAAVVNGRTVGRERLAAFDVRTGVLRGWAPRADGRVRALAIAGSAVYIGGSFGYVNGVPRDSLARLDAATGAVHAFRHSVSGQPYTIAIGSGRLYAGGTISAVDGQARARLAAFSLASGALDDSWRPAADSTVEAVVATADRVYVGGKFAAVNSASGTGRVAAVHPASGAVDTAFRTRAEDVAHGLAAASTGVYAAHGGPGGRLVAYALDGTARWTLTTDGDVQSVVVLSGVVYVGGHFDKVCRSARIGYQGLCVDGSNRHVKLAAVTTAGELLSWAADGNGSEGVLALAAHPKLGKLGAGGAFTTVNGARRERFAQFG
ncbi:hypothetical protein WEI85_03050 [Actinomycetes bacterium KLBMP 9797]